MTEFKGTPGPWRVDTTNALGAYGVWTDPADRLEENPIQICSVRCDIPGLPTMPREQRDANARLIAAAPELLAKLQKLHAWLTRLALNAEAHAALTAFSTIRDASRADAKNFRATASDIHKVIKKAFGQ